MPDNPNVIRIPLRIKPDEAAPKISEQDIILATGDIVYIRSREREVFYTGGMLNGREQLLPRDYDLDVLGAIALSGGSLGNGLNTGRTPGASGGGFGNGIQGLTLPPTEVIILRTTEDGIQVPIKVRLNRALENPAERILIKPRGLVRGAPPATVWLEPRQLTVRPRTCRRDRATPAPRLPLPAPLPLPPGGRSDHPPPASTRLRAPL
jgi:hypothetical protein